MRETKEDALLASPPIKEGAGQELHLFNKSATSFLLLWQAAMIGRVSKS